VASDGNHNATEALILSGLHGVISYIKVFYWLDMILIWFVRVVSGEAKTSKSHHNEFITPMAFSHILNVLYTVRAVCA